MQEKVVESKYAIESPTYQCRGCSGDIAHGASYFSAVFFEGEAFLRHEFCPPCWGKAEAEAVYACWKARRPEPKAPARRRRFDSDLIWEFFLRLGKDLEAAAPAGDPEIAAEPAATTPAVALEPAPAPESPDPALESPPPASELPPAEKVRLRFLLSLLLLRSKRLVLLGSGVQNGREWLRLLEKGAEKEDPEALHLVANPDLSKEDLEKVKESLGQLLQMEL
ncbi:MAG: hypothetical protein HY717_16025 [Planctomycetes bacterium]|nr:hypothetical protein [Planctomycetota bacterium]